MFRQRPSYPFNACAMSKVKHLVILIVSTNLIVSCYFILIQKFSEKNVRRLLDLPCRKPWWFWSFLWDQLWCFCIYDEQGKGLLLNIFQTKNAHRKGYLTINDQNNIFNGNRSNLRLLHLKTSLCSLNGIDYFSLGEFLKNLCGEIFGWINRLCNFF